jgi:hypothetical protein
MHQPLPEEDDSIRSVLGTLPLSNPLNTFDLTQMVHALLDRQIALVTRDQARKRKLPRAAEFASILETGLFESGNRTAVKPAVQGTLLTPDQDVEAMDATIPRAPDFESEE